jgi:hypothetical protein
VLTSLLSLIPTPALALALVVAALALALVLLGSLVLVLLPTAALVGDAVPPVLSLPTVFVASGDVEATLVAVLDGAEVSLPFVFVDSAAVEDEDMPADGEIVVSIPPCREAGADALDTFCAAAA